MSAAPTGSRTHVLAVVCPGKPLSLWRESYRSVSGLPVPDTLLNARGGCRVRVLWCFGGRSSVLLARTPASSVLLSM